MKKLFILFTLFFVFVSSVNSYNLTNNDRQNLDKFEKIVYNIFDKNPEKAYMLEYNAAKLLQKLDRDSKNYAFIVEVLGITDKYISEYENKQITSNYEDLTIKVITDSRDLTTSIDSILVQLRELPSIEKVDIVEKDFADEGVVDFLKENNIEALPVFVFSTNKFDVSNDPLELGQQYKINEYLQLLPNGEYYLEIGATHDPFVEISERGFKIMEEGLLEDIKTNSYTKGNTDAEVTWLEFSDFGCTYCQKMHSTDKTPAKVLEEYGDQVNIIFMNMPFRNREASEAIECIGELAGSDTYYTAIDQGFAKSSSNANQFYDLVSSSVDKDDFDTCISEKRSSTRIDYHMYVGQEKLKVKGTPNNFLINNTTGEYEVLPGAYPFDYFKDLIDNLLVD